MKHYVATMILLLLTAAAYASIQQSHDSAAKERPAAELEKIPSVIGEYVQAGPDLDPGDDVRAALETSAILMRSYRAPSGYFVNLTIVYAGTTRRSLHFPEVCLVGHGWEIDEQSLMPVSFLFEASKLGIIKDGKRDAVLYWYKTGENLTGSFFENSWFWAWNQLTAGTASSAMIRLSTTVAGGNEEDAFKALAHFAGLLTPVLDDYMD